MKKSILVVSNNYPSNTFPNKGAFVYNLMQKLAVHYDITIISPSKITDVTKKGKDAYGKEQCKVIRPKYLSLSNKKVLGIDLGKVSLFFQKTAVERGLKGLSHQPDLVYSHFFSNALLIEKYVKDMGLPLVVASGESSYKNQVVFNKENTASLLKIVNKIICVAEVNFNALRELGFTTDKMQIVPNAVDYSIFRPLPELAVANRQNLGISSKKFVVGFIGHFIERKGLKRLVDAVRLLKDPDIVIVAVGKGESVPDVEFLKVIEPIPNGELPGIVSTFDIFVLPTLSEGHCNVIEEVKACVVPVISSKGTSVEKQINENTGVLVDPLDVSEIAGAIKRLKDSPDKIVQLKEELEKERGANSLDQRALRIKSIIDDCIKNTA